MSNTMKREDYMTGKDKAAMRTDSPSRIPRTHQACIAKTGVARPGKTAKDRAGRVRGDS